MVSSDVVSKISVSTRNRRRRECGDGGRQDKADKNWTMEQQLVNKCKGLGRCKQKRDGVLVTMEDRYSD